MSILGLPGDSDAKESACSAGDLCSVPGSGRSSGEGNGNPLQYFCLENSVDRGAWQAIVHGVTKSQTQLSDYHSLTQLNYNAVLISAIQQNDSLYIHMCVCVCVCICFHIHFHYGLSQDIECSSPCFTEGPYCLSIAYTLDASANPKLPIYPPLLHDHISVLYFSETVSVLWIGSFVSYK